MKWLKSMAIGAVLTGLAVAGLLLKSMTSVALIGMAQSNPPWIKPVDRMTLVARMEVVLEEEIPS